MVVKIAVAQIRCIGGDVEANLRKVEACAARAAQNGCRLATFPEMADTGYDLDRIPACASPWDSGPVERLRNIAVRNRIWMITGISERVGKDLFNSVVAIDVNGNIAGSYRKTHLLSTAPIFEDQTFSAGDRLSMVRIDDWNVGLLVCYDLRFPEAARTLALKGAELLVVPSAWPLVRSEHFALLTRCRAMENQLFLACPNHVGAEGKNTFCGMSGVITPTGAYDRVAGAEEETILISVISKAEIEDFRQHIPTFSHRRVELYDMGKEAK